VRADSAKVSGELNPERPDAQPETLLRHLDSRSPSQVPGPRIEQTEDRFYRPELDAVRFFAFFAVLLHHGPKGGGFLNAAWAACDFGLSMFFLLSGFLITELLLRERERKQTVDWGRFFVRRALRIWPLYYAALACAFVIALVSAHRYWVSPLGLVTMSVFVANWFQIGPKLGVLVGHLWSISVEEQFYMIWAPVIKIGGKALATATSVIFVVVAGTWLWTHSWKGWKIWFDTPIEFLFFAGGALIAISTRGERPKWTNGAVRAAFLALGPMVLLVASSIGGIGVDDDRVLGAIRLSIGYVGGLVGCALIFFAMLGMPRIPTALRYLGKISYGLYVFHLGMLELAIWMTSQLHLMPVSAINMLVVDGIALILTVGAAHLSYQYFESPFLRLKERFTVIKSRAV